MSEQRNMILAAALSFLVIVVWQFAFAPQPPNPTLNPPVAAPADGSVAAPAPGLAASPVPAPVAREAALGATERVRIDTPRLVGSISLRGGRIDDLDLRDFHETVDPTSPAVTLLSPFATANPYYAVWGWVPAQGAQTGPTPGADTVWSVESGGPLAVGKPVTLVWDNGAGLVFRRKIAVDDHFLFSVTQSVENGTANALTLTPYAIVARHGVPPTVDFYILHEGAVGVADGTLSELSYSDMLELEAAAQEGGLAKTVGVANNGWLGFTDKYWMAALAGGPGKPFTAVYKTVQSGAEPVFQTDMRMAPVTVAPGQSASSDSMLFAGAKEVSILRDYQRNAGIEGFEDAVDWGWFFFLTKPIFAMLIFIKSILGNMGWSIIVLTLVIKAALFPLAYKSFVSMSRMKRLQPEMEAIKERVGGDKMKMQQEMIALYKREKVNPASGCLPILLQIPIFFSLYKVIFVTIELRHAPFIFWIRDLSAPDPSSVLNLFGLLPFSTSDLPAFMLLLSIGVYPILMGVTMWMQQKLNPTPTDPVQAQIFALMPFLFMFMLGHFAVGLVIYWIANNIITFTQQYIIMRSQGVDVDFLGNVKKTFRRSARTAK